ncbi:MAG: hypothetical protein U0X20_26505 [Caldilineaceae bacterium]
MSLKSVTVSLWFIPAPWASTIVTSEAARTRNVAAGPTYRVVGVEGYAKHQASTRKSRAGWPDKALLVRHHRHPLVVRAVAQRAAEAHAVVPNQGFADRTRKHQVSPHGRRQVSNIGFRHELRRPLPAGAALL